MIVLLRLIVVIFKSVFMKRIGPLDESVVTVRCWPNDLDLNFHMNSGRYLSMMDLGRISILCRYGILGRVLRLGWRPINGATMIRFKRSILLFDRFQVRSRVVCWDEKWFYFEHIVEKDGVTYAIAHVRGLLREKSGNVAPQRLMELAGVRIESPPMPDVIRLWNEAEALR